MSSGLPFSFIWSFPLDHYVITRHITSKNLWIALGFKTGLWGLDFICQFQYWVFQRPDFKDWILVTGFRGPVFGIRELRFVPLTYIYLSLLLLSVFTWHQLAITDLILFFKRPDFGDHFSGTKFRELDFGDRISGTGFRGPDFGDWISGIGFRNQRIEIFSAYTSLLISLLSAFIWRLLRCLLFLGLRFGDWIFGIRKPSQTNCS